MKYWLKKGILILTIGCLAFAMTGCQGEKVLDRVLEKTDPKPENKESNEEETDTSAEPEVDVAKPELTKNLSGSYSYQPGSEAEALEVEAQTTDEGVITYQWYHNQTNTNGGGTPIEGGVESTYTPPTDAEGTLYYYVVATSTIGSSTNGVTSDTAEVIVSVDAQTEEETAGEWVQDDKGWWYDNGDGTFPKSEWKQVGGSWYAFDENGYMRTGWFKDGDNWYYLQENGIMAADTDVEGYHLGSNGIME